MTETASTAPGWAREQWVALADRLLAGARAHASVNNARITFPGDEGGYGRAIDGLEGFARTFLIAGFRIAGERGQGVDDLIDFYTRGIRAGVDPSAPDRWVRLDEHAQAKVEAASLALVLDMTRPWIWDRLDDLTHQRVIDYFAPAVGDDTYPRNNWLWFRLVVQTFLRSVGGPWSPDDVAADLDLHDSFARAGGWLSDGDERSYDHYVGWALHLYPVLWPRMQGAADLAAERGDADVAALDRYLHDALTLVGADGSPLIQGRSLIYRFAAAAPFWAGVFAEVPSVSPGALRHAAERIVRHFVDRGAPGDDDLLTLGWHHEWRPLAQAYSGTGSPYWASKGLLGIALPADHPVWSAPAEPLPVEAADTLRAIASPGWIVSGTVSDGIVRVVNHGTDHAVAGSAVADSPLYARIGYSTATSPLLDADAWITPIDQSATLVDRDGRATHRAAMRVLRTELLEAGTPAGVVGCAASTARVHWIDADARQKNHGSGWEGHVQDAATMTVCSLVRGPWEARFVLVDDLADDVTAADLRLSVGGWAVSGAHVDAPAGQDGSGHEASARSGALVSTVTSRAHGAAAGLVRREDASPLGAQSLVPVLTMPVEVGTWICVGVTLSAAGAPTDLSAHIEGDDVRVTWPDGAHTTTSLEDVRVAARASR